jgi:DNA-binding NtrC family response regulator
LSILNKTILVVDDDDDLRSVVEHYLTSSGYSVLSVKDSFSAEKILREREVNLVLADLVLPRRMGYDLLDTVRKEKIPVKVIIISGLADVRAVIEAMKRGAVDYLVKPFAFLDLLKAVEEALT